MTVISGLGTKKCLKKRVEIRERKKKVIVAFVRGQDPDDIVCVKRPSLLLTVGVSGWLLCPGATPTSEHVHLPQAMDKERLYEAENASADATKPFLLALAEGRVAEPTVKLFLAMVDRLAHTHHLTIPIQFPQDHPVEEVGR